MKTKRQKTNLGKVVLIAAFVFAGSVMVACGDAADDEVTTDSDNVDEVDSVDVIDDQIDTFTVAPDLDTLIELDEILEEEISE